MTDARADDFNEEDRLPWLEAVEDEDDNDGPSALKLIAAVVIGLVAIGLIVGGLFWIGTRSAEQGDGGIIAAPEGDYKVRPDDPGGMDVEGEGDTAFAASEGADPRGQLAIDAVPETPVAPAEPRSQAQPKEQPKAAAPRAERAAPPAPAAPPATSGPSIQLGAFSSQASANAAWKALSERFRYLAPLSHSVTPVETGGRTLYRLRATGSDATSICSRLKVAGEDCAPVS